jgi:hypothetical protein
LFDASRFEGNIESIAPRANISKQKIGSEYAQALPEKLKAALTIAAEKVHAVIVGT